MNASLTAVENTVITGDCSNVLKTFPPESIDFVLSDPPYLTSYRPRDGRTVANDDNARWLRTGICRVVPRAEARTVSVSLFYGWPTADLFVSAFRSAGFRPISHLSFVKNLPFASYRLPPEQITKSPMFLQRAPRENPPNRFRMF